MGKKRSNKAKADEEDENDSEEQQARQAAVYNETLKNALKKINSELEAQHVLDERQVRTLAMQFLRPLNLEMDCLTGYLERFTELVDGKYYSKFLAGEQLTTARNIIIEIMIKAKGNQFKRNALCNEVAAALQAQEVNGVTSAEIQDLIDKICVVKPNKAFYALK